MKVNGPSSLPYGYSVNNVKKAEKSEMNLNKEREKQNEEKKRNLYAQKAFLEYFRECQKSSAYEETEEKGKHINTRA